MLGLEIGDLLLQLLADLGGDFGALDECGCH
jgi:hypothetical protein